MTPHYFNLEWKLDPLMVKCESEELMALLATEGDKLLEVDKGWRNYNPFAGPPTDAKDQRDTQW